MCIRDRAPIEGASVEAVRRADESKSPIDPRLPVRPGEAPGEHVVERIGIFRTDVLVSAPGYAPAGLAVDGAQPPETVIRSLALVREAHVGGHVRDAAGQPLASATVETVSLTNAPLQPSTRS